MVLNDERMRPVQVYSATGVKEWEISYTPFGEVTVLQDDINLGKQFGFAGQWFDEESGFYYNYYRDYDPALGRYIQSDPIGLRGGINTFAYARQNPLRYIDPYGLLYGNGNGRSKYSGLTENSCVKPTRDQLSRTLGIGSLAFGLLTPVGPWIGLSGLGTASTGFAAGAFAANPTTDNAIDLVGGITGKGAGAASDFAGDLIDAANTTNQTTREMRGALDEL